MNGPEPENEKRPLTPLEISTMQRGNEMLRALADQRVKALAQASQASQASQAPQAPQSLQMPQSEPEKVPTILGSDGLPISRPRVEGTSNPPPVQHITVHNPDPQTVKDGLISARMKRLNDNRSVLIGIAEKEKEVADVLQVMHGCHQLLFWARMELSTSDAFTDELIEDADNIIKLGIYQDRRGFNLREVYSVMRSKYLPLVQNFIRKYSDAQRIRKALIKDVRKRVGAEGITLPGKAMRAKAGVPFMPGRMFVLYGEPEATREALALVSRCHISSDKGKCAVLVESPSLATAGNPDNIAMVSSWWHNSASSMEKLYDVLGPIVRSKSLLLLIEDLGAMFEVGAEHNEPVHVRKSFVLRRLYQWGVEHLVAVVVADTPDPAVPFDYHPIPSLPVKLEGGMLWIGDDGFKNGVPVGIPESVNVPESKPESKPENKEKACGESMSGSPPAP